MATKSKRLPDVEESGVGPYGIQINGKMVDESSALLTKNGPPPLSNWKFWNPRAPSFRFFILFLATLVPFGGHTVKYSLAALQTDLVGDQAFHLSHEQYGSFQSAVSVPNLFVPFIGGMLLDVRGSRAGTIGALLLCLLGQALFSYACTIKSYWSAVAGRAVFGLGQGSTVVAQGHIAATYFVGYELVFAVALTESTHNLANWVAMVYVVPTATYFGTYIAALWGGVAICFISFVAGVIFFNVNREDDLEDMMDEHGQEDRPHHEPTCPLYVPPIDPETSRLRPATEDPEPSIWALVTNGRTSVGFVTLCSLHMIFSNCYHLYGYISADFIQQKFHSSIEDANWITSLSSAFAIFLCPFAGFCLDRIGYKMYFCGVSGIITAAAYLILAYTEITPSLPMLLLAICVAFVPTILRSSVPNLVHPALFGSAYGIYEVCESLGAVIGHPLVGAIRDKSNSYEYDLLLFTGMGLLAGILSIFLSIYDSYYGGSLNEPSRLAERTNEIALGCTCESEERKHRHTLSIVALQAPKGHVRSTSIVELRRRSLM